MMPRAQASGPATPAQMEPAAAERWLVFRRPAAHARIRLFCFHHAGGNALVYRRWVSDLPEWIDVCPVQLPGRGHRIDEPPLRQMDDLIGKFVTAIAPLLDRPVAVFGHSMGAAVAFAAAQRLGPIVAHAFMAARRSPTLGVSRLHELDDCRLKTYLRRLGSTPAIVFEDRELCAYVLSVLRADLALNDSFQTERALGAVPLTVLGGIEDTDVPLPSLEAWRTLTTGAFHRAMFPAGHFFTSDCREAVQDLVITSLEALI